MGSRAPGPCPFAVRCGVPQGAYFFRKRGDITARQRASGLPCVALFSPPDIPCQGEPSGQDFHGPRAMLAIRSAPFPDSTPLGGIALGTSLPQPYTGMSPATTEYCHRILPAGHPILSPADRLRANSNVYCLLGMYASPGPP